MLFELLRRHMRNILIVTVIIITPAFVLWGTGTGGGSAISDAVAMRINGQDVSPATFYAAVRNAEQLFGQENAVSNAVDTLLDDYVIREACTKLGIQVANAEIQDYLKQNPSFRNADGSFNAERWNKTLRSKSANWSTVVADARNRLQRRKLLGLLQSTVQIAPTEVRARYDRDFARRRIAYAVFAPTDYSQDITVDNAALQAFYEERQAQYREPDKIRLAVVQWKKEASALDKADIQALLADVFRQLEEGADFADLARQYSQGPTAADGGNLGYFTRDQMVQAFSQAFSDVAFTLGIGEVSPPVRTPFGWHIIKVEDKRDGASGTEVRARHILFTEEASIETLAELHEAATIFADVLLEQPLADAAAAAGFAVTLTDSLTRGTAVIPNVTAVRDVLGATFELESGQRTRLLDTADAFILAEVVERIPAHTPTLEDNRARVVADYQRTKAGDVARERAATVASAARAARDLAAVDAALAGEVTETELITRVGFIPGVGRPPAVMAAAFALAPGAVSEPLPHGDRWFVLQVRDAVAADPAGFDAERLSISQRLAYDRSGQAVTDFLLARKGVLRVEQNPAFAAGSF